jgi:hypothetical protein
MKKLCLAAFAALCVAFAGCASQPSQTPAQIAANVHTQVVKACAVIQPTLLSLTAMQAQLPADVQADLGKAQPIVASVCSAPAVQIASAQDLVNVAVPLAIKIISASPMKDADKTTAEIALTAASVALSAALAQYAPAVAVPASAASAQ